MGFVVSMLELPGAAHAPSDVKEVAPVHHLSVTTVATLPFCNHCSSLRRDYTYVISTPHNRNRFYRFIRYLKFKCIHF